MKIRLAKKIMKHKCTFLESKTINPHLASQPGGDFQLNKQRLTYKNKKPKIIPKSTYL